MKGFQSKGTATGSFRVVRTSKLEASIVPNSSLKEFFKMATPRLQGKEMSGLQWWGYLHTNGSIQVKRYFDARDLSEARESPCVQRVTGAFDADSCEEAMEIAKEKLNGNT